MLRLLKKKQLKTGLVGIADTGPGLAVAHVCPGAEKSELRAGELLSERSAHGLAEAVSRLGLGRTLCNFVVAPSDYNLLLVEAPKVKPEEMAAAVKWSVRDLIEHPLDEVALDVFPVPSDAYRSQGDMVYVVVARTSRIIEIRDLVEEAGLVLGSIDIPELAMLNLSRAFQDDSSGLAFMDLRPGNSTLNLTQKGAIYLTRHLGTQIEQGSLNSLSWDLLKDRLVLEIQRSLDYYESQMGQRPIRSLLIAPQEQDSERLVQELDQAMAVKVENMELDKVLTGTADLSALRQHQLLLAIGGALRSPASRSSGVAA